MSTNDRPTETAASEPIMQLRCLMCYSVFTTPTWRLRCPECVLTCAKMMYEALPESDQ